ncbi:MAG: molecular chaperone TorD family protein [Desulfarculaceae bacterium]|nr:molecular chaperone TorD family protein [Desulfarculaceae bacterium]MCF8073000.1 molecular chaperone TorD family protein [Desulfarculaceae bacterium]MCF8100704.1 molecular chaperone TorD family protein [Desulfarculaceae bacterium]MCF8115442.1 molecular chaperone TorD family protein [Desulfarculaceae bacterium]
MSELEQMEPGQEAVLDGLALLARLYWGPDPELCGDLAGPETGELLGELAGLMPDAAGTMRSLGAYIEGFAAPEELCAELEPGYVELFVSRPGGVPAPLYHSCYVGEGRVMGPPAGSMAARLEAEGLALEEKPGEPPDHLAVELEYLIYLLEEAWGGRRGEGQAEAAEFAGRFMLPWVKEFLARQEEAAPVALYPLAAKLLIAILELLAAEVDQIA